MYEVSGVMFDRNNRPRLAAMSPGIMSGLGPNFGKSCEAIPAKIMIPTVKGRNAKPDFKGL